MLGERVMKKNKLKNLIIAAMLIISTASIVGCGNTGNSTSSTNQTKSAVEEEKKTLFKNMKTKDLNGNEVTGSIFSQNKLTVVNVWNTGCTPCIDEIPVLDKINNDYKGRDVSLIGLLIPNSTELSTKEENEVKEILEKSKATYNQLVASSEMLKSKTLSNLTAFPTTYFVDKEGNIIDSIEGSGDYNEWKNRIEKVLKGLQ